jgi:hypothetical protein
MLLALAVLLGWYLTASSMSDLIANAWMLIIIPFIGAAYYFLKDRVRDIPETEEE